MSDFSSIVNKVLDGNAKQLAESISANNALFAAAAPKLREYERALEIERYRDGFEPYLVGDVLELHDASATEFYDAEDSHAVGWWGSRFVAVLKPFARHVATNEYLDERGKDRARLSGGIETFVRWLERKGYAMPLRGVDRGGMDWAVCNRNIIERPKEPE